MYMYLDTRYMTCLQSNFDVMYKAIKKIKKTCEYVNPMKSP